MGESNNKQTRNVAESGELDLSLLTPRQRKFIIHYFESGDVSKAAIAAGIYKKKPGAKGLERVKAASAGSRLLRKIRPQVEELMDSVGLSAVQILRGLQTGIEATTTVGILQTVKEKDEETGVVKEILRRIPTEVIDHKARQRYVEMAMKARGMFPALPPAVVNVRPGITDDQILTLQHSESLKGRSKEDLEKMLNEAIDKRKTGRLRVAGG